MRAKIRASPRDFTVTNLGQGAKSFAASKSTSVPRRPRSTWLSRQDYTVEDDAWKYDGDETCPKL